MRKTYISFIFFVLLFLTACSRDTMNQDEIVVIELFGDLVVEIEINDVYEELGFVAYLNITETDVSSDIVVSDNIDNKAIGTYTISYEITHNGISYVEYREVIVLPYGSKEVSIELVGAKTTKVDLNSTFVDPFVVARDERYGIDVSHLVVSTGVQDVDTSVENAVYTISYLLEYKGVTLTEFRAVEVGSDDGVKILVVNDNVSNNKYFVGEEYVEHGVSIFDETLGVGIENYFVNNNFQYYDDGLIKKGSYYVEYSVFVRGNYYSSKRFVIFEDQGVDISVNNSSSTNNTYGVGQPYVEYGVTARDKTTGVVLSDYIVADNFVYDSEGLIVEGTYYVDYSIIVRGIEYQTRRNVIFEDLGFDIDINNSNESSYYVGEDYLEYGITIYDNATGDILSGFRVADNFVYDFYGNIKSGVYDVTYTTTLRGREYSVVRFVEFESLIHKLDFELESKTEVDGVSHYLWNITPSLKENNESIRITSICYMKSIGEVICVDDRINGINSIITLFDKSLVISFSYEWNNKTIEGVV